MFEVPEEIRMDDIEYEEVDEYGMMCDDLSPVSFSMIETDKDNIYKARFTMEASVFNSVDKHRFREFVEDCHGVTDDNFDYISVESEPEFSKEFGIEGIEGTYKISIQSGESQEPMSMEFPETFVFYRGDVKLHVKEKFSKNGETKYMVKNHRTGEVTEWNAVTINFVDQGTKGGMYGSGAYSEQGESDE